MIPFSKLQKPIKTLPEWSFDTDRFIGHPPGMQPIHFEESVAAILKREKRYDPQAYFFLKDSLDFTLKRFSEGNAGKSRHVSGKELLEGFRDYALEQFGPMGATLMEEWGIQEGRDVGNMVFQMIEEQVFGKQDSDRLEDFDEAIDFKKALRKPFLPKGEPKKARAKLRSGKVAG